MLDILEYWIADPLKEMMTVCTLLEGWYEVADYTRDSEVESPTFSDLKLTAKDIL